MNDRWKKFKAWFKKYGELLFACTLLLVLIGTMLFTPIVKKDTEPKSKTKTEQHFKNKEVTYLQFEKMVKDKKVSNITIELDSPVFKFEDKKKNTYQTANPKTENFKENMLKSGIKVNEIGKSVSVTEMIFSIIKSILPLALFFIFLIIMMKNSRPFSDTMKENHDIPKLSFDQVAGNEEPKNEMKFLVEFLKHPDKFTKMGAKLPKGVILYGDPGTGKTLIAKAIAGEAKVPFFSISGSDFVEMYVGLGAKRVRELFQEARKKAPAIIFIDEIDSLGSKRDSSQNSEDRKTLNAILNEMDGFKENSGIVVIGATNRLNDLDPAFIRPGRFDKHIAIGLPDKNDRLEIIKIHAKNKLFASDVNLENLANITLGMSGAYLETILNEATIIATTRNHTEITNEDIDDAYYKMVIKGHKKKRIEKESDSEARLVAWHEAGHALVAKVLGKSNVPKVTITPSTSGVGGFALITPKKPSFYSKEELKAQVKGLYAGRVAEYLLLKNEDDITQGASNDIQKATEILQNMIVHFGMSSKYGMINLSMLGNSHNSNLSNNPQFLEEITSLSKSLYEETVLLLKENIATLQAIAERLLEKETIEEEELDAIIAEYRQ